MASAWGQSFGSSWGDSWGSIATVGVDGSGDGGARGNTTRKLREIRRPTLPASPRAHWKMDKLKEDDEILLLCLDQFMRKIADG